VQQKSVADLSYSSSPQREKGNYLELCDIKIRLDRMQVFLVMYSERDGRRLNDFHAETMFIRPQPIDHRSTIRIKLGEVLQLSIRDIVKPLQPRGG
jgi:hypothetical protein